ncbi:porin [Paraburkholderia sp. LEh10]|uniref:porin n=1 Tax=Paraburkholderia sp. LEh10 TaxID=2821353 RepID=UPI001AE46E64|nr:porin [Paraburkholderia sp. LEh10]MBP0590404.1 porin [Paraburkholderia sp. LEh10]
METKFKWKVICGVAFAGFASVASAQSQVTLYGVIDEGIMFLSNTGGSSGGKKIYLDSVSGILGSRWGMKGTEDLGGGLSAIFTIESGINLNNGTFAQGGTAFGRQSFVGLNSSRFGSLTLGRQYDMLVYFGQPVTIAGQISAATFGHPGDLDNASNDWRTNNAVRYMSPNLNGFTFGGEYSVGGVAGNITANSGYSLGAGYSNGLVSLGAAFLYFKNPSSSTPGSGYFTGNANGASALAYSLNSGYQSAQAFQSAIIGATINLDAVTLISSYSNTQYANLGGRLRGQAAHFSNIDVGAKYFLRPEILFAAAYDYLTSSGVTATDGTTLGNQHYHQVSFMTDYLLSKRTDVYLTVAWQHASGTSSTGAPAVANITLQGDSTNNHQFLVRVALKHKF